MSEFEQRLLESRIKLKTLLDGLTPEQLEAVLWKRAKECFHSGFSYGFLFGTVVSGLLFLVIR